MTFSIIHFWICILLFSPHRFRYKNISYYLIDKIQVNKSITFSFIYMQHCSDTLKYCAQSNHCFLIKHPPPSFDRIPTAGVGPNWPDNIYFTFQFYRFPPVTSQQLKLLTSDKVQHKASDPLPCVLASINNDGTVNSGKDPRLQRNNAVHFLTGNSLDAL